MRPNRQELTQIQPRSSIGSPMWASSQSSTARTPSGPIIRLPLRKSPCTNRGAFGDGGQFCSSQRNASSNTGPWPFGGAIDRLPLLHQIERRQHRQGLKRTGVDGVDAGKDIAALARQHGSRRRQRLGLDDPAAQRLARDETHHEPLAEGRRRAPGHAPPAAPERPLRPPPQSTAPLHLVPPPSWRCVRRPARGGGSGCRFPGANQVEAPDFLRGAAGQTLQVPHAARTGA